MSKARKIKINLTNDQQVSILQNLNPEQLEKLETKLIVEQAKGKGIQDLARLTKDLLSSFGDLKLNVLQKWISKLLVAHLKSQGSGNNIFVSQLKDMRGSGLFGPPHLKLIDKLIKGLMKSKIARKGFKNISKSMNKAKMSSAEQRKFLMSLNDKLNRQVLGIVKKHHKKGSGVKDVINDILKNVSQVAKKVGPVALKEFIIPIAKALILKKIKGSGINLAGGCKGVGVNLAGGGVNLAGGSKKKKSMEDLI